MASRLTFNDIVARVKDTVPVRPKSADVGNSLTYAEFSERLAAYHAWAGRQAHYIRANGSEVGFSRPWKRKHVHVTHGERAARRPSCYRHLRTIPRDSGDPNVARCYSRINPNRFNREPFLPDWMTFEPSHAKQIRVIADRAAAITTPAMVVPSVRPVDKRVLRVARKPIRSIQMWRPTPLRPPLKLVAHA